jgi:23S rRNA maturation-related 3'-5' exoribonuclease YhaM
MRGFNMIHEFTNLMNRVNRKNKEVLIGHLHTNGYFKSACSSQYHGANVGGLLDHSVNVTKLMLELRPVVNQNLKIDIQEESCIIVGLLHDCGKAGYFGEHYYIPNELKSGKASEAKPYKVNENLPAISHEAMSLHIVSKYLPLTYDEVYAILYHNGIYTPAGSVTKGKERPLQQLLHFADMQESHFGNGRVNDVTVPVGMF